MLEIIITSSILILIVLALRFLLRGKLSPTVIYALWAIVALRLLLPFSLIDSRVSVMNLFEQQENTAAEEVLKPYADPYNPNSQYTDVYPTYTETISPEGEIIYTYSDAKKILPKTVFAIVWVLGAAVVMTVAIVRNIRLYISLKSRRESVSGVKAALSVYVAKGIGSPFLFGFPKPAIYMNPFAAEDERRAGYVITHELMHYRHLDHIWAVVRMVCVSIHWFNPLVWLAAYLSRQDSELACDSAVIRVVGEEYGIDYGRTLVDMVNVRFSPTDSMLTSTTMSSDMKSIKERLTMITSRPQTLIRAAVVAALIIAVALVVTFTGAAAVTDKPVEFAAPEDMTMLPLHQLPYDLSCTVYDPNNPLNDISASIRTSRELNLINHVLLEAYRNKISPEEIPTSSWIAVSFSMNTNETYQITNDGYVIMRRTAEYGDQVNIDTNNVASGMYYDDLYGFYRIPEELFSGFIDELKDICKEYVIVTPGGVGQYRDKEIQVIYVVRNGDNDNAARLDVNESEAYSVLPIGLNSSVWSKTAIDSAPAADSIALRLVFNNGTDIFDFTKDGRVYVRYVSDELFSDQEMTINSGGAEFARRLENYLIDRCDVYSMPEGTYETILQAADEALMYYGSAHPVEDREKFPDQLAEFTSFYNEANIERTHNISTAAGYINGTVLEPGETFSFNDIVGQRTPDRGFVKADAYVFEDTSEDYGGGISQVSTALYNAAVISGMEITEQHNHRYTVDYAANGDVQFYGNDACVAWGTQDLCFINCNEHPVIILMTCSANTLTAYIYGTDDGVRARLLYEEKDVTAYDTVFRIQKPDSVNQIGQYGRTLDVYYAVSKNGEEVSRELARRVTYLPVMEIIYTENLPDGCEYDVVYESGSIPEYDFFDTNEVWKKPEYAYLLDGVPIPDYGILTYHALHPEGEKITQHSQYDLVGTTPPIDWLILIFNDITHRQKFEYIDKLHDAGFVYHADDGSDNEDDMCVFYNAPQYGVGVQIDSSTDTLFLIFFPQGDGCYGYSEHIPKG